jgi:hypothetical protein
MTFKKGDKVVYIGLDIIRKDYKTSGALEFGKVYEVKGIINRGISLVGHKAIHTPTMREVGRDVRSFIPISQPNRILTTFTRPEPEYSI